MNEKILKGIVELVRNFQFYFVDSVGQGVEEVDEVLALSILFCRFLSVGAKLR
jgi:hypothetical protein